MELVLSCYACGSTEFDRKEVKCIDIEGTSYHIRTYKEGETLTCSKCGLGDYMDNLVIQFR